MVPLVVGGVGIVFIALIAIVVLLILAFIVMYNDLVGLKNKIENAWAQIDVQLKQRADLVPNLVETVKGYAKHEKTVFTDVTKARASLMKAGTVEEKAKAQNMLTDSLKSLFAVAENYPQLKANENFKALQDELVTLENKIAYTRQYYNDAVVELNKKIEQVPTNIVAGVMGLKKKPYFEARELEREAVKVKFE